MRDGIWTREASRAADSFHALVRVDARLIKLVDADETQQGKLQIEDHIDGHGHDAGKAERVDPTAPASAGRPAKIASARRSSMTKMISGGGRYAAINWVVLMSIIWLSAGRSSIMAWGVALSRVDATARDQISP